MPSIEIVEVYGIRINRKEASLLRIVMEHPHQDMRDSAMRELTRIACPEALEYIVMKHPHQDMRDWAMKALKNL